MGTSTLIKQTLTVKKVIFKADSKISKACIIVPLNGKDEFLGLNDGVDEKAFEEGKTYDVELSISKTGKRYVNKILGTDTVAVAPVASSTAPTPNVVASLDRDTRISLMNIGNIAGNLSAGDASAFKANIALVKELYQAEGII